jgi:hypothetical protein
MSAVVDEAAEVGKLIGHGKWLAWLGTNKKKLGIGDNPERAAQRLVMLAENPTLTSDLICGNTAKPKVLPPGGQGQPYQGRLPRVELYHGG